MNGEERAFAEAEIAKTLRISIRTCDQSRICPDPVNLLYDDINWFPRRTTPASDFMRIKRAARLAGWTIQYLDYGIGHDAHILTRNDTQMMAINYRSARATNAELNGQPLPLEQVLTVLCAPRDSNPDICGT